MKLYEIKKELDVVGSKILEYSFKENLGLEKLAETYSNILEIRDELLESSFMEIEIEELEQIRFSLIESLFNIKILIQEHVGQDTGDTIDKLKELYENSEVGKNEYR